MNRPASKLTSFLKAVITCTFLFVVGLTCAFAEPAETSTTQEQLRLGERIYRDGILPSGEAMVAYVKGDVPVSGTAFSCVSCHLRSGLGSVEGGVFTPPTNGVLLYQPYKVLFKGLDQKFFPFPDRRPAYNDATLAEVIRSGENPTGTRLNDVMPRYLLDDKDMAILIAYLKSLSSHFSPGVSDTSLHFATVITDDVSPKDRDAMLAPLELYINIKNNQAHAYQKNQNARSRLMAENMLVSKELSTRTMTLSRWILKGSPETWRKQLDEYNRKEPVFALLGGISNGDWSVIHRFCEDMHIPCLLPQTDFPVISATSWYTLYPSKGYYQEGEAAAGYLNSRDDISPDKSIIQIVRDSREGKALSDGFVQKWHELGRKTPVTHMLKAGEELTSARIESVLAEEKPAAIVLWDGPEAMTTLNLLSTTSKHPALVFVSSRYLGGSFRTLPERARDFTYLTYPFSFAQKATPAAMGSTVYVEDDSKWHVNLKDIQARERASNAFSLSNSITSLLTMALMDLRGNYYSDNFFDVISMVPDQPSEIYGRLSFGPGQRYASKGCYVVQLTEGQSPELVKKSDWVIY